MLTDNNQIFRNCFVIIYCYLTKVSSQINKCIIFEPNELSITLSTLWLYGAEAWGLRSAERRKVNVLEMKCLRNLVLVSRMDRVRNEEVRRRAGIERELACRADQRVLRWFGHVDRIVIPHGPKGVVGGSKWRPRLGWMDGVKVALGNRGMTVEAAREDRKEWRALVHM